MAEEMLVVAKKRALGVRNPTRKGKLQGFIPAVLYNKHNHTPLTLERHAFTRMWAKAHSNTIFTIEVEGQKKKAFVKQVNEALDQGSTLLHLDFFEIEAGQKIKIKVPIKIKGLAKGITQGGILDQLASQVTVRCLPEHLPEVIEIDVTELEIGDHFKMRDLKLGDQVEVAENGVKSIISIISTAKRDSQLAELAAATPAAGAAPAEGAAAAPGAAGATAPGAVPAADAKKEGAPAAGAAPAAGKKDAGPAAKKDAKK